MQIIDSRSVVRRDSAVNFRRPLDWLESSEKPLGEIAATPNVLKRKTIALNR